MTMDPPHIAVLSGLVIGLIYGSVGLLSGFCMMSGLRGWWAECDSRLARIVKRCQDLPGEELFQYQAESGELQVISSGDVNDYLREITGRALPLTG